MITQESFESHLKIAIEFGREFFARHPDGEFIPVMFLVGLTNGQQKTTVMVLPDALDAHKYPTCAPSGPRLQPNTRWCSQPFCCQRRGSLNKLLDCPLRNMLRQSMTLSAKRL